MTAKKKPSKLGQTPSERSIRARERFATELGKIADTFAEYVKIERERFKREYPTITEQEPPVAVITKREEETGEAPAESFSGRFERRFKEATQPEE